MLKDQNLTKLVTIRKRADFIYTRDNCEKFIAQNVILQFATSNRAEFNSLICVGYTATKKLGGAVIRNRIKRRIRHAVNKLGQNYGVAGYYYVFICRKRAYESNYKEIIRDVKYVMRKARKTHEKNSNISN